VNIIIANDATIINKLKSLGNNFLPKTYNLKFDKDSYAKYLSYGAETAFNKTEFTKKEYNPDITEDFRNYLKNVADKVIDRHYIRTSNIRDDDKDLLSFNYTVAEATRNIDSLTINTTTMATAPTSSNVQPTTAASNTLGASIVGATAATSKIITLDDFKDRAQAEAYFSNNAAISMAPPDMSASLTKDSVADLGNFTLTGALITFLRENAGVLQDFGLMNSHIYRMKLIRLMSTLSQEEKTMVVAMACIIKSKRRIMENISSLPNNQNLGWIASVKNFYNNTIVDNTRAAKTESKFAVQHIPSCLPELDLFFFMNYCKQEELTIKGIRMRTTFSQVWLVPELQYLAKAGYDYYWNHTVVNKGAAENPEARDAYYNNIAGDTYKLLNADGKVKETVSAYTIQQVKEVMNTFRTVRGMPALTIDGNIV